MNIKDQPLVKFLCSVYFPLLTDAVSPHFKLVSYYVFYSFQWTPDVFTIFWVRTETVESSDRRTTRSPTRRKPTASTTSWEPRTRGYASHSNISTYKKDPKQGKFIAYYFYISPVVTYLHRMGTGSGPVQGTGLSLSWTSVNISTWYYTFYLVP